MEKRVTQRFRCTSVQLGSYSDLLSKHCASMSFPSSTGASYTSNKPPSAPPRQGDAVDALEEEEEEEPLTPLLAALPLFQPTLRPSKTSLRRSSNMSSSASLMMPRLPAAELCT